MMKYLILTLIAIVCFTDVMHSQKLEQFTDSIIQNVNRNNLKGAILYVIRYGYNENTNETYFLNSKPCEKCTSIIKATISKHGLKAVYYSTGNDFCEI